MACEETKRLVIGCITAIVIVLIAVGGLVIGHIFSPASPPRTALQECARGISTTLSSAFCVELAKRTPEELKASTP